MATVRIQVRRGTANQWSTTNPTLAAGEIGLETDTLKFKVGNGSSAWNSISSYANVVPGDLNTTLNGYLETSDLSKTSGTGVAELTDGDLYIPGTDIIFEGTANNHELTLTAPDVTSDKTITLPDATTTLVGRDTTDTLTNKTITSPTVSGLVLSDSSIVFEGAVADSYETTLTVGEPTEDRIITLPNVTGTVITTGDTGTVTNAMLAGSIANEKLTNSSITINGTSTSLGGSRTLGTDDISEGATNKYFTDERAQDAIGNAIGNGLDYDDNTGAISVDPSEFTLNAVGAPSANVDMASFKITNLAAPTTANDAATKSYVDNTTAGLNFHAAVHAATTANLNATYSNGTGGVGATLTANANEAFVLDGHTLNADERVLIKNQTTGLQNGIYVVTATGDGSNPWILTRATDADNSPSGEVAYGDFTFVQNGTSNGGYGYIVNTPGTITLGTTSISYVQFNTGQAVIAGNGLTEPTAGTIAINTAVTVDLNTAQTLTNKTITGSFTGNLTGNADTVTNGVVTSGSYSNPSWITGLAWTKISSTPTTLSGYGITDAAPSNSPTFTGTVTLPSNTVTNDMLAGSIANNKLANSSVTINGSAVSLGGSVTISAAPTPQAVSSNITMLANYNYFVDTSSARTLTLPASPSLGDTIAIYDAEGSAATNNITVSRNSNKINGLTENATIDVNQSVSIFVYTGSTLGWKFD